MADFPAVGGSQNVWGQELLNFFTVMFTLSGANGGKIANGSIVDAMVASGSNIVFFPSATKLVFFQPVAPTGWTQIVTQTDKALRVVSGAGGGFGGSLALSSANVGNHTLTIGETPSHAHDMTPGQGEFYGSYIASRVTSGQPSGPAVLSTAVVGGGGGHNHPLSLAYIDVIVASKN